MSPRTYLGLHLFVGVRFQVYFTPLVGVLFTFPSRYWFTIGHQVVLSLGRWSSRIPTGFLVSRRTQEPARLTPVSPTGLSPSLAGLPRPFDYLCESTLLALQPHFKLEVVWAGPRSLATTSGVSIDFLSSGYLDVSVPWVRLKPPMYSEISYLHLITENPNPRRRASL